MNAYVRFLLIGSLILAVNKAAAQVPGTSDSVQGPVLIIAGAGVGYGVAGPDVREKFTVVYAGTKLKTLSPTGAIYACYQHGVVQGTDVGGNGARLMLVDSWRYCPSISIIVGMGFLEKIKQLERHELKTGLTFDAGLSYDATEWLEPNVYAFAMDRGPRFSWAVVFTVAIKNPQKLFPGF